MEAVHSANATDQHRSREAVALAPPYERDGATESSPATTLESLLG